MSALPETNSTSAQALRVHAAAANLDALKLELTPQREPVAAPGFAVVRVGAAAVNPSDVKASLGLMPQAVWPRSPGRDFAGTVVDGPSEWLGREVYGSGGDIGINPHGSAAPYPVVVPNILAWALVELADTLTARVAPGGRLAMSGILAGQEDEVIARYTDAFEDLRAQRMEDWMRVTGVRRR